MKRMCRSLLPAIEEMVRAGKRSGKQPGYRPQSKIRSKVAADEAAPQAGEAEIQRFRMGIIVQTRRGSYFILQRKLNNTLAEVSEQSQAGLHI